MWKKYCAAAGQTVSLHQLRHAHSTEQVRRTRDEILAASLAQKKAAQSSRALVQRLKALGLSGKDTAIVLGITPQRVSQLAAAGTTTGPEAAVTNASATSTPAQSACRLGQTKTTAQ